MNITSSRALFISTLSPVHIGCDEVFEPSNFVIHDGLLHALDPTDLAESLNIKERQQLAGLADQREPIGAIQRFFRDHAERFSGLARHQIAVAESIVNEYNSKAGVATQRGPAGEATYNVFPIARTAYRSIDNIPFLPGSSLKGSIRTAWLNHLNHGAPLSANEKTNKNNASNRLQERLLGYSTRKLEDDPFRHLALADAHPDGDDTPPPTRVLYAISKKKRLPRDGERSAPEIKVFLETIPDALPAAFLGEMRLGIGSKFSWNDLCDACNQFYRPQLESELRHPVLSDLMDAEWKKLVTDLLGNELSELMQARQGFLLRVGRHSGAESVTLNGLRNIKILGSRIDGKQNHDFRPNTTEIRFASLSRAGASHLLPFGWIWVETSGDAHYYLSESVRQKLAARSRELREAHREQLSRLEEQQEQHAAASAEAARKKQAEHAAEQAALAAQAAHQIALQAMTPGARRIEEFKTAFAARAEQLRGGRERLNGDYHSRARTLAQEALAATDWNKEEKASAADAIAEWLPKVVEGIDKEQFKKLKLSALRGL